MVKKMNLWQTIAAEKMSSFIQDFLPASKISFNGSLLDPNTIDVFSDVDMKVSLLTNALVNMKNLISAFSERVSGVLGYEIHNNYDNDVLRMCLNNGWRYDLTFVYPEPQKRNAVDLSFLDKVENTVNSFWFASSMALVKLGRNDYLIAAHLALELCQLVIVMQMLVRDEEKKTNIHRFGDREDVPVLHSLLLLRSRDGFSENNKDEILNIIFHAAEHMEKISAPLVKHPSRTEILKEIQLICSKTLIQPQFEVM
jgi:hypothetical protein